MIVSDSFSPFPLHYGKPDVEIGFLCTLLVHSDRLKSSALTGASLGPVLDVSLRESGKSGRLSYSIRRSSDLRAIFHGLVLRIRSDVEQIHESASQRADRRARRLRLSRLRRSLSASMGWNLRMTVVGDARRWGLHGNSVVLCNNQPSFFLSIKYFENRRYF